MHSSSLLSMAAAALAAASPVFGSIAYPTPKDGFQCAAAATKISCRAQGQVDPNGYGTCCYNGALNSTSQESGLVLSTQFYTVGEGPKNSTTIHGLWPDYCSGAYPQYCSSYSGIPEYSGAAIDSLIAKYDPALSAYFKTYYKDSGGDDAEFRSHEWNKHGTCFTTNRQKCQVVVPPGANQSDAAVLGYFREIAKQFQRKPTVQWLAEAGITPTNAKTYKLADLQNALAKRHGATPYIGCVNKTLVDEFWYYNNVQGPLVGGIYYPVDSTSPSSCSAEVRYVPK